MWKGTWLKHTSDDVDRKLQQPNVFFLSFSFFFYYMTLFNGKSMDIHIGREDMNS